MERFVVPDGLVVFVKRDCPTCELLTPALVELAAARPLTVYSQDDCSFPGSVPSIDDTELSYSWHHDIETVPTLLLVEDGAERARTVGWDRDIWRDLTGVPGLADALPPFRPGCGSLSVDPDRVDALRARFEGGRLRSRRVELAELEDEIEAMYDRGWSDGLPLVPPTPERVERMLDGTARDPGDHVATVGPNLVDCTVEKVAINSVMAGCRPEYLPVVLAAVEAVCTDEYNVHGVLATTMAVGPIIVVNGPIRRRIGMNSGINVLGPGNRANATIGRAVQLVVRNVGGGRPGEVDRATLGNPGKLGLCFAEDEEGSPWESLAVERGFSPEVSTVTVFTGEGPRTIVDQKSRRAESLVRSLATNLLATVSTRTVSGMDAMLVLSPEHAARFRDAGWSKQRFRDELAAQLLVDTDSILEGADGIDDGLSPAFAGHRLPKFAPDGGLLIVHAGGPAGLFSSVMGGWLRGAAGSIPVTTEVIP